MGKSLLLSPTMVDTERLCSRKAAGKYCSDWPREEPSAGITLGNELHEAGEAYLKAGIKPDRYTEAGKMLIAGLPHLPKPRTGVVEGHSVLTVSGFSYQMYVDWRGKASALPHTDAAALALDVLQSDGYPLPATLDHKTSKDPKKYGVGIAEDKPGDKDTQVLIYSALGLVQNPEATHAFNRWLYYKTGLKKPKVFPSDFVLSKAQVWDRFGELIHPSAVRMKAIWDEQPDPNEVEPTAGDACSAFGGCPYSEIVGGPCRLTNAQKLTGMQEDSGMGISLLEKLKADKAAKEGATNGAAVNPTPQVVEVVQAEVVTDSFESAQEASAAPAPVRSAKDRQIDLATRGALAERIGLALLDFADYFRK